MKTFLTINPTENLVIHYVGSSAPSNPWVGMLWLDTSASPPVLKCFDGVEWCGGVKVIMFSIPGNAVVASSITPPVVVRGLGSNGGRIERAYARCLTAPAGADLVFDVKKNGSTIWTNTANRLRIVAGQTYGETTNIDVRSVSNGDYFTIDIVQRGSTTYGANITVFLEVKIL